MDSAPRLTIGLPVYNGARFLRAAVESLLAQTFTDFELIISDNASTDETGEIGQEYARRDERVRYRRHPRNLGAAENFNHLARECGTPFFKWSAHDDYYAPTYLERCMALLESDPAAVLAQPLTQLTDENDTLWRLDERTDTFHSPTGERWSQVDGPIDDLCAADPLQRFRAVVRRAPLCFQVFGVIRTPTLQRTAFLRPFFGSDKVLLAELSLQGPLGSVPERLFFHRTHPEQATAQPVRSREVWMRGRATGRLVFPIGSVLKGCVGAVWHSQLPLGQRARGVVTVLSMVINRQRLRRLLLPGPKNYLGINWRRRRG